MDAELWVKYRRLQEILDRTTNTHYAAGIEAAMTTLLDKIKGHVPYTSQQVNNLVGNRIFKERRRRAIAYWSRDEIVPQQASDGAAESRLMLRRCAEACGSRDFTLLVKHAQGHTFGELAAASDVTQNTLKIRAYRARQTLLALLGEPT